MDLRSPFLLRWDGRSLVAGAKQPSCGLPSAKICKRRKVGSGAYHRPFLGASINGDCNGI